MGVPDVTTTMDEATFRTYVRDWLDTELGRENVFPNVTLSTDRRPDFVALGPLSTVYMIEVENERETAVKGAGQALLYGAHELDAAPPDAHYVPVVVVPTGDEDSEELARLARHVHIVELDTEK